MSAKLSWEQVCEIRSTPITPMAAAHKFNVSPRLIQYVRAGRYYKTPQECWVPEANRPHKREVKQLPGLEKNGHKPFVTTKGHPLVRELCTLMNTHQVDRLKLCTKAGVHHRTLEKWRYDNHPRLEVFEAVANAMGYKLALVPTE